MVFEPMPNELPFSRFGILLPILMLSLVPTLILLAIAKSIRSYELFVGAEVLTLLLIFGSSVLLVVSGMMGAIEYAQYRRATGRHAKHHLHSDRRY
jgi:hypothetical protein